MVWSLSKDDDGLEPAVPLPGRREGFNPTPMARSDSSIPPGASSHPPPSSTVVVDPISQIPPSGERVSSGRRAAEPTRILSARKIDELRAQAQVHHKVMRRQKVVQFLGWGLAGALAVAAGGLLAGGLLPRLQAAGEDGSALPLNGSAASDSERSSPPSAEVIPQQKAAAPAATLKRSAVLEEPAAAQQPAPVEEPDSRRAVSLDELEEE